MKNGELVTKDCRKSEIDLDNIDLQEYEDKSSSIVSLSQQE